MSHRTMRHYMELINLRIQATHAEIRLNQVMVRKWLRKWQTPPSSSAAWALDPALSRSIIYQQEFLLQKQFSFHLSECGPISVTCIGALTATLWASHLPMKSEIQRGQTARNWIYCLGWAGKPASLCALRPGNQEEPALPFARSLLFPCSTSAKVGLHE